MNKINLVMFNMSSYSEWQRGIQNRNYHILKTLLKNENIEKIVAIDYMPYNFKRFVKNYKENYLNNKLKVIKNGLFTKVYEIDKRLIVYSSVLPFISKNRFYSNLNKYLKVIKFNNYHLWSAYPLSIDYFDKLKQDLKIFDAIDNWSEHPAYNKIKNKIIKNYELISKKADIIFTVSDEMQSLFLNHDKVYWIPNGVDIKHYQQKYAIVNRDIGSIKKPIIGYVGTVQDRFDIDLVEFIAKENNDKSIVIVGPVWNNEIVDKLSKYSNIYFLGRKSYTEVPMYIQQFDIGIIPHKLDKFIKFTNPMKMFEYLACGKPIISSSGSGIEMFKESIHITNDYRQFNHHIQKALKEDNNKLIKERLEVVKEHSWLKRVDRMLEIIKQ